MEHPTFTLSGLCIAGGIAGYARRRSIPSLVAGVGVGALFGVSGYLLKNNKEYGIQTALVASTILAAASIPRALKLRKGVPIVLSLISIASTGYYATKYKQFYLD